MTRRFSGPEPLEHRIAPALAFALDANNTLISFDLAEPKEILSSLAVSGLIGGDTLLGMDFRASDGNLYGIGSGGRLYSIDPGSGEASLIATLAADPTDESDPFTALNGSFFGVDFNPVADRIRLISDTGENLRINPENGLVITDAPLAYALGDPNNGAAPVLSGAAYTNAYSGATSTTLYALDAQLNTLVLINPPNGGTVLTVGALGIDADTSTAFDIAPNSTDAYALMTAGGVTSLYKLNLGSGGAALVGGVGTGAVATRGFVILPGELSLVNDRTATYIDADGDRVTVKVSKGKLSANDFRLIAGGDEGAQLAGLNLSDDGGEFVGASVTIKAAKPTRGGDGDGFVNVGEILADVDLNKVKVDGDLGRIRAGDNDFENNKGVGLKSLKVHSLGVFAADTGAESIVSTVAGSLNSVNVRTDLAGSIAVSGLDRGDIGKVKVGGSLAGGDEDASGRITATGDIGLLKIGGDVRGGAGIDSGRISAGGDLKTLKIGGSLIGGYDAGGTLQTQVQSNGDIGKVTVKHDVSGGLTPGSGSIYADGSVRQVKIGGSLAGGEGESSGQVGAGGEIRAVVVRGSVVGGNGDFSGSIYSLNDVRRIAIKGSLLGGSGAESGRVEIDGELRKLTIGGDVRVGEAGTSNGGSILAQALGKVAIGGNLIGSEIEGQDAIAIASGTTITKLKIKGDVLGTGESAAVILAGATPADARKSATLGKVDIGGSATGLHLLAGYSGLGSPIGGTAEIAKVVVKGDFIASNIVAGVDAGEDGHWGTADDTAVAQSTSSIGTVQIKGQAAGTGELGDHFGIVAEAIRKVQAGGLKLEIPQGITDPGKTIGWSEDLTIRVVR